MTRAFHPIIELPTEPSAIEICDFTRGYDPNRTRPDFSIGRYDEKRPGMYETALFREGARDVHMGIDLGAPAGTPVHAFNDGEIFLFADNTASGDYGPTLVTHHTFEGRSLYVLHGHLARRSLDGKRVGNRFTRGAILGWIGEKHENGGWNPHVHVQLAWSAPEHADLPGVVSDAERARTREAYPDPRLILGPLY
ncbi:MAG: hypothetical protein BGO98_13080 [Myxococcales bacterium 68-20]|nr:peptidoglycan DD-metalloendopeptidase family protein [Myxococcales bacterium]OJY17084.1 MAG: hypothetical protein BGO98_13080 [Myxococcales bacterium 68-20]